MFRAAAVIAVLLSDLPADPCANVLALSPIELRALPDGGAPAPAAICHGQAAPADGVFLTVDGAARLAAERAELRADNDALKASLAQANQKPQPIPGWVWVAVCVGSIAATTITAHYVKK